MSDRRDPGPNDPLVISRRRRERRFWLDDGIIDEPPAGTVTVNGRAVAWSATLLAVLASLTRHADREGFCRPSMKTIAAGAGVKIKAARNSVRALELFGLVETQYRFDERGQIANGYVLNPWPAEPTAPPGQPTPAATAVGAPSQPEKSPPGTTYRPSPARRAARPGTTARPSPAPLAAKGTVKAKERTAKEGGTSPDQEVIERARRKIHTLDVDGFLPPGQQLTPAELAAAADFDHLRRQLRKLRRRGILDPEDKQP